MQLAQTHCHFDPKEIKNRHSELNLVPLLHLHCSDSLLALLLEKCMQFRILALIFIIHLIVDSFCYYIELNLILIFSVYLFLF